MAVHPSVRSVAEICGDSVAWALLEQHLLHGHVDLAILMSAGRSRSRLRQRLIDDPRWPVDWAVAGRAVVAWILPGHPVSEARQLSLEWDCRPEPGAPFPFVSFEHSPGVATDAQRALRIAEAFAEVVEQRPLTSADRAVIELLPKTGSTLHFACPGPRGQGARRWVSGMEPNNVEPFLRSLEWPGDSALVGSLARQWGSGAPHVSVHLDVASRLLPRLGLELFFPGPPRTDRRWAPLMAGMRERRLATDDAIASLQDWPGEREGLTRLLDMKVVFDAEGPVEAKAYLACCASEDPKPGA